MKLISTKNNIIHFEFSTMKELTLTMCRPQEFYECADENIRGKYFTMFDLLNTYMKDDGDIDYWRSWAGFNIPSNVYEDFIWKFFTKGELTPYEIKLFDAIDELKLDGHYYIIASLDTADSARDHEYAHGFFYLNKEYQKAAIALVEELPYAIFSSIKRTLLHMGYAEQVIVDEIHAYIATSDNRYFKKRFDMILPKTISKPFKDLLKPLLDLVD